MEEPVTLVETAKAEEIVQTAEAMPVVTAAEEVPVVVAPIKEIEPTPATTVVVETVVDTIT